MESRKFPFDAHLLCVDKNVFDVSEKKIYSGDVNIMKIDIVFMVRMNIYQEYFLCILLLCPF